MSTLEALRTLSPFNSFLNMHIEELEHGFAKIRLPWSDQLIGDPNRPAIHGGVLAALMDATGGAACFSVLGPKDSVSTIDLQINYLEPGSPGDFICEAKVVRAGNRVGTVRMDVYSQADSKRVAIGTGVYNLVRLNRD